MGYHHCPIEPDDWANGPNEPEGQECHTCEGTGEIEGDYDGQEQTCPSCQGSGSVEPNEPDYDFDWGSDARPSFAELRWTLRSE